jgi:hypothetical protein
MVLHPFLVHRVNSFKNPTEDIPPRVIGWDQVDCDLVQKAIALAVDSVPAQSIRFTFVCRMHWLPASSYLLGTKGN